MYNPLRGMVDEGPYGITAVISFDVSSLVQVPLQRITLNYSLTLSYYAMSPGSPGSPELLIATFVNIEKIL